ncbi:DUF167 domain-containing protein [Pseudohongiella spirulinae]|uniref:UPF0235 protein PS2015_2898 n=1 Tax=Pseudohongiella spirulinae TaxID=1249552 RepID=A0A0S2KGR7_9GAMM|nr:DUF167 domain-containing protein [Pseudohongiella spirulinae]ALO47526.1 hypothetical protein PS2015_2898 [Pseudohongiella spirulinae]
MSTVVLSLKVIPGASRNQITGWLGEELKVKVATAPEAGKANRAVEKLLATYLKLPQAAVVIVAGHANQHKRVQIQGATFDDIVRKLPLKPHQ